MATNLLTGKLPDPATTEFLDFKAFYEQQNEATKGQIRLSMCLLFDLTENAIFRRIKLSAFNALEIHKIYKTIGVNYSAETGFFLAPKVSIMETLDNHGLSK